MMLILIILFLLSLISCDSFKFGGGISGLRLAKKHFEKKKIRNVGLFAESPNKSLGKLHFSYHVCYD